jgi:hypothetical protein
LFAQNVIGAPTFSRVGQHGEIVNTVVCILCVILKWTVSVHEKNKALFSNTAAKIKPDIPVLGRLA